MSLKASIVSEFRGGPIRTTSAILTMLVTIGGFLAAWRLSVPQVSLPDAVDTVRHATAQLSIRNLLMVLSFSLGASLSGAWLIRILGRRHPFPAFILSAVTASIVAFLSVLVFCMIPPRQVTQASIISASNAASYATVSIFIAINGYPVFMSLAQLLLTETKPSKRSNDTAENRLGFLGLILILVIGWGTCVSKGQSMLTATFIEAGASAYERTSKDPPVDSPQ